MKAAVILVAAGRSTRLPGAVPKPLRPLAGTPLAVRAALPFANRDEIAAVLPVAAPAWGDELHAILEAALPAGKLLPWAEGGEERQDSVANGLAALPPEYDPVLVHDAARPMVSDALVGRVLEALRRSDAVVPVLPVADTVKEVEGDRVVGTLDRERLRRIQTPQGFRREVLAEGLRAAAGEAVRATDDAAAVERAGLPVTTVPGEAANLKVTTEDDLEELEARVRAGSGGGAVPLRIGNGIDFHPFEPGRELWIGGVLIPHQEGLAGHSDGDVLCHAVSDALLGAAGLPDLGHLFPDSDPRWKGARSLELLREVGRRVAEAGWDVENVDAAVILERPRLAPHLAEMREAVAGAVGADPGCVSIKAKHAEGLGALGRGEGAACQAVALLRRAGV